MTTKRSRGAPRRGNGGRAREASPDLNGSHSGDGDAALPHESTSSASLLVCIGFNVGHRYTLGTGRVTLGNSRECDIVIPDPQIAACQAALVPSGAGHRILHVGHPAGLLVNASPVLDCDLCDGDLIQLGMTVLRYAHAGRVTLASSVAEAWDAAPRTDLHRFHAQAGRLVVPFARGGSLQSSALLRDGVAHADGWYAGEPSRWRSAREPWSRDDGRDQEEEDDVSFVAMVAQLRRVVEFFWPYRVRIGAAAAVGLLVGLLSVAACPPSAAAFFDVRLHSKASANPLERYESTNVEFFRSAPTTFRSTGLIARTLDALGEKDVSAERLDAVQKSLTFDNTGTDQSSQTWTGSYRGEAPEKNLRFLTKHVELYLNAEIDKTLKIIKAQVEFLQTQLEDTERQLRSTESKLLAFKKENIDGLPDQARQYYDYLFELQRKESDLANAVNRLDAEAAVDARRLAEESPLVESRVLATRPYQQAIVDVNRQLTDAHARGLGEDHPDVRELRTKLEGLRRLANDAERSTDDTEVERSRNPIYESTVERMNRLRVAAAAAREERLRLRQDQQRIKSIVDRLPRLEAEYAELTRSYDATKQLHTRIFDQLKTAQLQLELEKASASARYEIITAPRLEHVSLARSLGKRALLLALVGACAGVLFAALAQARKALVQASA